MRPRRIAQGQLLAPGELDLAMLSAMPERWLEGNLGRTCRELDVLRYHTLRSRGSEPGFPDDQIIIGPDLIVWELKSEIGKPTRRQQAWLDGYRGVRRIHVGIKRPTDWPAMRDMLIELRQGARQ